METLELLFETVTQGCPAERPAKPNSHYIMSLLPYLHRVSERSSLSSAEAQHAMESILSGQASAAQIAGFLVALRMKGETVEELVGFARAMRRKIGRASCRERV